ncbi:uncharacterized protein LOC100678248 isoform X1 [Nasonia vitripennis]|uniref:Uncharacterized protein n=1 Tax=Nasonia vitripennis TaxID=7425 RepID=A0A7M7GF31_NASVI|nr:uncharacterized protein LOC100678248 isoform X1 [Nasonia vitripennis]
MRMSESDSEEEYSQYSLKKYALIRFIHRGRKRRVESIDIVPSKWLDFDKRKARCVTKFLEEPYSEEDLELLHKLVIADVEAPEDWPTFSVKIVGRAGTYKEALMKIKKLETEDHVLTLESEDSASEAQRQLTLAVKRQKLQMEAEKLNEELVSLDEPNEPLHVPDKSGLDVEVECQNEKLSSPTMTTKKSSVSDHAPSEEIVSPSINERTKVTKVSASSSKCKGLKANQLDKPIPGTSRSITPPSNALTDSVPVSFDLNQILDAPIFYGNVECKTPFEAAVIMRLDQLASDMIDVKQEVASLKGNQAAVTNFLADKKLVVKNTADFEGKYQIPIPLLRYENFQAFEEKLKTDDLFKKDVYLELKSNVDKVDFSVSKSIVKMMKKFFTKDLAMKFTAIRLSVKNKEKIKFRPTELCAMMEAVIAKIRKEKALPIDTDAFNSSLTDVLTNISRWK